MELTLIRHGENEGLAECDSVYLGWGEFSLTERGRLQALKTAEKLSHAQFDLIISSDVKRAVETASIIFPQEKYKIEFDGLLRERGCGELSGLTAAQAGAKFGQKFSNNPDRFDLTPFGGEHVKDMELRVRSFIKKIEKLEGYKKIAVVTHGGPLRAIAAYVLGTDIITLGGRILFSNCSISNIRLISSVWQIKCLNNTEHLDTNG